MTIAGALIATAATTGMSAMIAGAIGEGTFSLRLHRRWAVIAITLWVITVALCISAAWTLALT